MSILLVQSHSEEETKVLAEKLSPTFRPGDVIVLTGPLGSGKTIFVKGLAKALGHNEDNVNSPSYTLVNEYPGKIPVYHFDLYRMGDESELVEIGWDDYLTREGIMVVEWGEKAGNSLPRKYYWITFKSITSADREISIEVIDLER